MPADSNPDHHARRRERRRRVAHLRRRPLGDLNVLPDFLTSTLGISPDIVSAAAAELGPLLDGAGYRAPGQSSEDDVPLDEDAIDDPSLQGFRNGCQDDRD